MVWAGLGTLEMRGLVLIAAIGLSACAPAMDRITATEFEPTGPGTFRFKAPIALQYPDNEAGESARLSMLQGWLDQNVCPRGYDITGRNVVQRSALTSDVIYFGKCKA
jgi:hypothetical protein